MMMKKKKKNEHGDIPQLRTLPDLSREKIGEGADHIPTILMWEHLGSLWFSRVTNLLWQRLEVFGVWKCYKLICKLPQLCER